MFDRVLNMPLKNYTTTAIQLSWKPLFSSIIRRIPVTTNKLTDQGK